jgi:transmembrane sensor
MADFSTFDAIIERFVSERLSEHELPQFFAFLEDEGFRLRYEERIDLDFVEQVFVGWSNAQQPETVYQRILNAGSIPVDKSDYDFAAKPKRRVRSMRTSWLRWASAAVIIFFVFGAYLYYTTISNKKEDLTVIKTFPATDIAPGGNKAVLTLADGSAIILDSAALGQLALQGNAKIIKLANGQIAYQSLGNNTKSEAVSYNTMTTPKGGQYQLTLPDGSKVWLNAASSITYPTAFVGKERNVSVNGEAYFEIAQDSKKPFFVKANNTKIAVLGTQFNINSYGDEANIKTTLLEGSVKVISDDANKNVILKPGQQAIVGLSKEAGTGNIQSQSLQNQLQSGAIAVIENVNVDQIISWKKGLFNFTNADLTTVMRQLARWYDIQVKYEGTVPSFTFQGELDRGLQLSEVLKILSDAEVKFKISGRTLVILSK